MSIFKLTPDVSVAPQIEAEDLETIKAMGFRSIINNRPDQESAQQPGNDVIADKAAALGLDYRFIPVVSGSFNDEDVAQFRKALDEMEGPVLAFCRSGTRSSVMWALANAGRMPAREIIAAAGNAGFDLSALQPRLERDET
ncbi:MAG TPA: TIGR01244 family sulfur transferase [Saliniramus sp.]|nr:TIGR01244 family sulfur transferase [Saliniramus sp.]